MSNPAPRTVLVTGATAGIGRHAALHLARRGLRVIASGRKRDLLASLAAEAAAEGLRIDTVALDVTDAASIAAAAGEVARLTDGRGLDGLVNNAGYGLAGPLEEITDADLRAQFDTNVFGLMAVTRAFLPAMRRRGAGRIVNVSSVGGRVSFPFMGAYTASKFAVEALSDALRREVRGFGVEVSLIEPGPIQSDFSSTTATFIDRYASADSPYAVAYGRAEAVRRQSDAQAVGPLTVSRAIEHALTARRPRARYVRPRLMYAMIVLSAALPTRWLDWVMAQLTGMNARQLAATSTMPAAHAAAKGAPSSTARAA